MRRRLRAARELAGYERLDDLVAAIGERGFGRTTLYKFEQGRDRPGRAALLAIADACGLPVEWFDVDLPEAVRQHARRGAPPPRGELGRRLEGRSPTDEDQRRPGSSPEADAQ